ncbi:hypothetical protein Tco_0551665 [Tanacetum coccineum]
MGRPFLATIHAQIDVFKRESSLGIGEDRVKFDMDGGVCHSRILVEKIYMANSVHEEEYLNPLKSKMDYRGSVRNEVLNQWVLDSFDVKADYGKTRNDPYSRRKNAKSSMRAQYRWHDEGFEEEERWECGIEKTDYEPPFVDIETFEIKRYSFKGGRSFICIAKQLDDALPLGRVNGSRFIGMIRKEMDEEGGTIRKT